MYIYNNWLGVEIDNYIHFATHGTKCFVPRKSNKEIAITEPLDSISAIRDRSALF